MAETGRRSAKWDASWEGARRQRLKSTLSATPAQRLAWLEEALKLAHDAKVRRSRKS